VSEKLPSVEEMLGTETYGPGYSVIKHTKWAANLPDPTLTCTSYCRRCEIIKRVEARDEAMILEGARRLLHWQMENCIHLDFVDLDRLREIVKGGGDE
jgi:hypothetical protein